MQIGFEDEQTQKEKENENTQFCFFLTENTQFYYPEPWI
jgi:hypothetical protein